MRRLLALVPLCLIMTASLCSKKPKDDDQIVVIIEDATISEDTTIQDTTTKDTLKPEDVTRDTVVKKPRDTTTSDTLLVTKDGIRTMSLTGAVALLEHDVARGDAKRLLRHTEALENAISLEIEKIDATSEKTEEVVKKGRKAVEPKTDTDSERKRTLNLFLMKLWSLKRAAKDMEKKGIPEEKKPELQSIVSELDALARRIEGKEQAK